MASLAVFLCPEKVGIARVKSPGLKPSFSSPQWRLLDNVQQLLDEPLMLASLIREMVGDDNNYDIYLNLWPGAYSAVMFSNDKKSRSDVARLRQSELETVFRGDYSKLYTHDLMLNQGKPFADNKIRRIIFALPKERLHLLNASFSAQKMKLQRVAPMDVAAAEAALRFWAPKDKSISVCMVLDEACTSVSFMRGGVLYALRTIPNGFNAVLSAYMHITAMDHDTSLYLIRNTDIHVADAKLATPPIQDDVLRTLNRVAAETVKTLHNTFGDEAVIDHLLLCGNFVHTVGLVEYLNTILDTECIVAGPDTLTPGVKSAIALDEADLEELFPLAATTAKGTDLMSELKKNQSDKISSLVLCSVLAVITVGLMVITPMQKSALVKEQEANAALLAQPEYVAIQELMDTKSDLGRQKSNLEAAIEALPHGGTNTAGILGDLIELTANYGTVRSISADYGAKTISLSFTTLSYDSFVYWQKALTEDDRFSFRKPPTFDGNGLIYSVSANLTAVDFDAAAEEPADTDETGEETSYFDQILQEAEEGSEE